MYAFHQSILFGCHRFRHSDCNTVRDAFIFQYEMLFRSQSTRFIQQGTLCNLSLVIILQLFEFLTGTIITSSIYHPLKMVLDDGVVTSDPIVDRSFLFSDFFVFGQTIYTLGTQRYIFGPFSQRGFVTVLPVTYLFFFFDEFPFQDGYGFTLVSTVITRVQRTIFTRCIRCRVPYRLTFQT